MKKDENAVKGFGIILPIVLLTYFMILLDNSIIFTSTVHISNDLSMSSSQIAWVSNAYALTFGGLLLFFGRLGDIYGRKYVFLAGLVIFTIASFLVGVSQSATMIIAMRAFQGIGSAILAPTTLALLMDTYKGEKRSRAIAYYGVTAGLGSSFGLLIGGLITSYSNWRYGFLINVPVGILMCILTWIFVPQSERNSKSRVDWWGAVFSVIAFSGLVYFIDGQWLRLYAGLLSLLAFVCLIIVESKHQQPLMPLSLFRSGIRASAYISRFFFMAASMSYFFLMPQALQNFYGFTPFQAALAFIPMTATQFVVSLLVNKLSDKFSHIAVLIAGAVIDGIGIALGALIGLNYGYVWGVAIPMLLIGIGQGLVVAPMTIKAVEGANETESGAASGVVNTVHQIGGAVGLSIVTLLTANIIEANVMIVRAQYIMLIFAVIMVLAGINIARVEKTHRN
ncbi:MFS transporter [Alloscardovia theropitheci]|uniref:MFS transporter n=1 Tax=Alloscardovia theropitheci TaxID=2496842 RepID=A0A4R0QVX1_9BIFI|nr:MFS transporter [Alloscardovia theropitheci]TCD53610.1 MFS transporter [Alloscardovia theropitheci]